MSPTQAPTGSPPALPLRDIRGPVPIDIPDWQRILIVGALLVLLMLLALGVLWWRKRNRQRSFGPSCDRLALERLQEARELIDPGRGVEFAEAVADILRTYLRDRFHLQPHHQTTREFIASLAQAGRQLPPPLTDNRERLRRWLLHCDLAKFARSSLSPKVMEEMADNLEAFIRATRPVPEDHNGTQQS